MKVDVFEPAMCCSTGICGTEVDEALLRFAADVDWFKAQGGEIERHNLSQQPMEFVDHPVARAFMERSGEQGLPLILLNDEIVLAGRYPTRSELARWCAPEIAAATGEDEQPSSCCCSSSGCC